MPGIKSSFFGGVYGLAFRFRAFQVTADGLYNLFTRRGLHKVDLTSAV